MLEMGFDAEIVDDATLASGKVGQSRKSSQKLRPFSSKPQVKYSNQWTVSPRSLRRYLERQEETMATADYSSKQNPT